MSVYLTNRTVIVFTENGTIHQSYSDRKSAIEQYSKIIERYDVVDACILN